MAVFYVICPHCSSELEVDQENSGVPMECPLCHEDFVPLMEEGLQELEANPTKQIPKMSKLVHKTPLTERPSDASASAAAPFAEPLPNEPEELPEDTPAIPVQGKKSTYSYGRLFILLSRVFAVLCLIYGAFLISHHLSDYAKAMAVKPYTIAESLEIADKQESLQTAYDDVRKELNKMSSDGEKKKTLEIQRLVKETEWKLNFDRDLDTLPRIKQSLEALRFAKENTKRIQQFFPEDNLENILEFNAASRSLGIALEKRLETHIAFIQKKSDALKTLGIGIILTLIPALVLAFLVLVFADFLHAVFDIADRIRKDA